MDPFDNYEPWKDPDGHCDKLERLSMILNDFDNDNSSDKKKTLFKKFASALYSSM